MSRLLTRVPNVVISRPWKSVVRPNAAASMSQKSKDRDGHRYKAVIFDMGGVILPSPFEMFKALETQAQMPIGTISQIIVKSGTDGAWHRLEQGDITLSDFAQAFSKECSQKVGREIDVSPLLYGLRGMVKADPFPEMIDAVKCVRAEGLKTALLTNNWYTDDHKSESLVPLDTSLFDVVTESCRVGRRKPHPDIYKHCLSSLQVEPQEALFLDDLGINLKAANKIGIDTIKVSSPTQGVQDLEEKLGCRLQGYAEGTSTVPKHLALPLPSLAAFLRSRLNVQAEGDPIVRCFDHGQSNPTYYVQFGDKKMVLRKKPIQDWPLHQGQPAQTSHRLFPE